MIEVNQPQDPSCFGCAFYAQKVWTNHEFDPPKEIAGIACTNAAIAELASFSAYANSENEDKYLRVRSVRANLALYPDDFPEDYKDETLSLQLIGDRAVKFFLKQAYPIDTPADCPFFTDRHAARDN